MTTYKQTVRAVQDSLKHSLIMLKSDPNFQEFIKLMEDGRDAFYRQACQTGISQKDQDKLLGAANFADQTVQNATITLTGHGSRNTSDYS